MRSKFWGVVLMMGLLLLLAVAGTEASVIIGTGEGGGPVGMAASAQSSPLATMADATGCVATGGGWYGPGQSVSTNSGNHVAAVISVHIPAGNPTVTPTFCTDLVTGIGAGACFQAAGPTACPITWLMNNGYGPAAGLTNAEAAARQAAIWNFSDNLTVNSSDPVYARTQEIIAAVPNPCTLPASAPILNLSPSSATNMLPGGETHTLTVNVTRDGAPLAGQVVNLQTDFGTLSAPSVTTGADGSASFTVTSNDTGTATITAKLSYVLPAGTRFTALPGAADQQVLVLGTPQTGDVIATATKTWQTGSIVVHKFHDENLNQVQDGTEASLSGWSMKLQRLTGTNPDVWADVNTQNTNASGNATFTPLAAGTYRAVETMQSGWQASTPNPSAQIVLATNGVGQIDFGNFRVPAIKIWKFNDLNRDGVKDANEPTLDGWQMNIQPAINGVGACTTAGGFCAFENLSLGVYEITEALQSGWMPTTDPSPSVNVTGNTLYEVWIGNAQADPMDLGDLPDTGSGTSTGNYNTNLMDNGPRHITQAGVFLGNSVDTESNGQPNATATGDDAADVPDDEDGVVFKTPLVPGRSAKIEVTANVAGCLNAWVDWNGNGQLGDVANERIANNLEVSAGTNTLTIATVPSGVTGVVYSRFRFTQTCGQGGQNPTGLASSGEVEDYALAALGDYVWVDTNNNGVQDDGNTGLNDVTVKLLSGSGSDVLDGSGTPITTVTANNPVGGKPGWYEFPGLPAGSYIVQFVRPDGYSFTTPYEGGNSATDSNAAIATGKSEAVTLAPGQTNMTIDAGLKVGNPTAVSLASFSAKGGNMPWGGLALLGSVLAGLVLSQARRQRSHRG